MKERQSVVVQGPAQIEDTLQVGLQVIVQKEVGQERTWAKLVGWVPEGVVILDGPAQWVGMGQLFAQNRLLVRFVSLGSFYGFTAKVLTVIKSPLLVILEWPKQLDKVPLSSETRCVVHVPIHVAPLNRDGSQSTACEALLTDISLGGCQAKGKRAGLPLADFQQGRLVRISLQVPLFPQALDVLAQVRNTQITGSEVVMGLRFEEGQAPALERMHLLLAPMLRLCLEPAAGLAGGLPPAPAPAAPAPTPAPASRPGPALPLDTAPLAAQAGRDQPPPADGPRVFEVPEHLRVDTTATKVTLEDMPAERAAAILGVRGLGGSMAAMVKARELVRAWVEKHGEPAVRERRRLLLSECAAIQGLKLLK
ncbi:MAG: flagellar brake protein [Desulfarculus sp.]|nr:flagellar brake protein [Desulfarculus sp.]